MGSKKVKSKKPSPSQKRITIILRLLLLLLILFFSIQFYIGKKLAHNERIFSRSSFSGNILAARYAEKKDDVKSAYKYAMQAYDKDPKNLALLDATINLAVINGDFAEAFNLSRILVSQKENHKFANLLLAVENIKQNNTSQTKSILLKLRSQHSNLEINSLLIDISLAWVTASEGSYDGAVKILENIESKRLEPFIDYQIALISDLYNRPDIAENKFDNLFSGNFQKHSYRLNEIAVNFYDRTAREKKSQEIIDNYNKNYPLIAETLKIQRSKERKINNYQDGIAELFSEVSSFLGSTGLDHETIELYQIALYLNKNLTHARYLMAETFSEIKAYDLANTNYQQIDSKSPFKWKAKIGLAENLYATGKKEAARNNLLDMSETDKNRYDALITAASIALKEEDFSQSAKLYSQAISRVKIVTPAHWFLFYYRGISYERINDWDKAESDLEKALELNPDHPEVLNYLAYSWVIKGKNLEKSLQMLGRALEINPHQAHIIDSYGWALFHLKKYNEALEYLEKAENLTPSDPSINEHLGDVYWKLGRTHEARFQWKKALDMKPETNDIPKIKHKINNGLEDSQ